MFDVTPASNESSEPATPAEASNSDLLSPNLQDGESNSTSVSRTGSILNLTSSTLYGIYKPTAFDSYRDESSPWGTEAHTPVSEYPPEPSQQAAVKTATEPREFALRRTRSRLSHGMFRGVILPQALSSALLFGFGIVYGVITINLHDNHWITPVKLENVHYYDSWQYLGFWGLAGIALGNVLPWLDSWRDRELVEADKSKRARNEDNDQERTPSWVTVARSVGAFVGIAFAMVCSNFLLCLQWIFANVFDFFFSSLATTPLGIHYTGLPDPRHGKPRPLVPHRPNFHWFPSIDICWCDRDECCFGPQA
jgi:hypothetical protein